MPKTEAVRVKNRRKKLVMDKMSVITSHKIRLHHPNFDLTRLLFRSLIMVIHDWCN